MQRFDYNMFVKNILIGRYEFGVRARSGPRLNCRGPQVAKTNQKPGHEEYKKYSAASSLSC